MSDTVSVSSGTTGVSSQQGHRPHQQQQYQVYSQQQQYHQQQHQPQINNNIPYFYPNSHIHNAPSYHSTYSQSVQQPPAPTHPYVSSPPIHPQTSSLAQSASLTSLLLSCSQQQLNTATNHPFLRLAGQGRLPKRTLSRWLSQDRLYAQSYIGFIGALIARVDLPYVYVHPSERQSSLRWRLVKCLSDALTNIHTELKFFSDTADKYGLDLETPPREGREFTAEPATKSYIDLFRAFWTDPSMSLLEGMVVLWATETCYLKAWTYARSFIENHENPSTARDDEKQRSGKERHQQVSHAMSELEGSEVTSSDARSPPLSSKADIHEADDPKSTMDTYGTDADGGALRSAFIPNWTSPEFSSFVDEIAALTDQLAEREDAVNRKLDVYKAVWRHILDVERRFWPDVGE